MKIIRQVIWSTLILICCSCSNITGDIVLTEIQRTASKDHKVEAVLITSDGGATTSTAYHIFIVKSGGKVENEKLNHAVFTCDNNSKINMFWADNKKLVIAYDKARV